MYTTLKLVHVCSAILTISGFVIRGIWSLSGSSMLHRRVVRVAPHIVDTVFLVSGIGLVLQMHLQLLQQDWLMVKLAALLFYIGFGILALRMTLPIALRFSAFVAALATFGYIVGVALSKSPQSWLSLI